MFKILASLLVLYFSNSLICAPAAYTSSKCKSLDIINTTNSTVLGDNQNCNVAWVLPPISGKTQFSGFTPTANINMCQELKDAQAGSGLLMERIKKLIADRPKYNAEADRLEQLMLAAQSKVLDLSNSPEISEMMSLKDELSHVEREIVKLNNELFSCTKGCELLQEERQERKEQRTQIKTILMSSNGSTSIFCVRIGKQ